MQQRTDTRLARTVAAVASIAAGSIHLAVTPDHWQEWILSGLFFLGLAGFQLLWPAAVVRFPRSWVVGLGVLANLASIAVWGISRLWGFPVGPNAGVPQAVGLSGVLTVLLESVVVVAAVWFLLPRERTAVLGPLSYRLALGGAVVVVAALMAPGVVAGLGHDHGEHGHAGHHGESAARSGSGSHGKHPHSDRPASTKPSARAEESPSPTGHGGHDHEHSH